MLIKLVLEKIHNERAFKKVENFSREIEKKLKCNYFGTTNGIMPSYSGFIEIDTIKKDDLVRKKRASLLYKHFK